MPLPIDPRKKPTDVKVFVTTGEGVAITWSDGHASRYTFPYLRDECPCATCRDEREKKALENPGAANPLPMFKARVTAKSATSVGNYAIQIQFSDGHATGIYSFDALREMCPCEACSRDFRNAAKKTTA
jgi:DUF971 family protein